MRSDQLHDLNYKTLVARLEEVLSKKDQEYLEKKMGVFRSGKMTAEEMFEHFVDVFGLKDVPIIYRKGFSVLHRLHVYIYKRECPPRNGRGHVQAGGKAAV